MSNIAIWITYEYLVVISCYIDLDSQEVRTLRTQKASWKQMQWMLDRLIWIDVAYYHFDQV